MKEQSENDRAEYGQQLSIEQIVRLTRATRKTVVKRLLNIPFSEGKQGRKLYDSQTSLTRVLVGEVNDESGFITNLEAQRQLTIARKQQIELEMEVVRKERVPISDVLEVNEELFGNMRGIIKSTLGKTMSIEHINDLFCEMREVPGRLKATFEAKYAGRFENDSLNSAIERMDHESKY